jgi:integrase
VGLPGLRFHDLRRSVARNLQRAGVPESVIMRLAGWKTRAMFTRYDIVDEADIANGTGTHEAWLCRVRTTPRKTARL